MSHCTYAQQSTREIVKKNEMRVSNMNKQVVLNGSKIGVSGTNKQIENTLEVLQGVKLTGYQGEDRLIIQKMLDSHSNMACVLYDGNIVYPAKNLLAELGRMKKNNSIEKMSNNMYQFLTHFDIAHYNKQGFIAFYDGSYTNLVNGISHDLKAIPAWRTDLRHIVQTHFGYYR